MREATWVGVLTNAAGAPNELLEKILKKKDFCK